MNGQNLINVLLDPTKPFLFSWTLFFGLIKIMVLIGLGIYVVFALVIVRQIAIMVRTLTTPFAIPARLLGLLHLLLALLVWIFAFITL